jgi:periplasmic divalent cation tolerance protein
MVDSEFCQVMTAIDSREAADALAQAAVWGRLAACAQVVGPIASTYWWENAVESAEEWLVLFKTRTDRYDALEEHIRDNHPYDLPEILCTPVTRGNPAYLAWVRQEVDAPQLSDGDDGGTDL